MNSSRIDLLWQYKARPHELARLAFVTNMADQVPLYSTLWSNRTGNLGPAHKIESHLLQK
jgi:hypothetical protein